MLHKTFAALAFAGAAVTTLASPASAGTPTQVDQVHAGGFMAAVDDTTFGSEGYRYTQVTFGRGQQPDGSMVALASYYESGFRDGLSYDISGNLFGLEATAAYQLRGLDGGELHATMPTTECIRDPQTWQATCTATTRRVDAIVTAADGAPTSTHRVMRSNGCHLACWTSSTSSQRRLATGSVLLDGASRTTESSTASVGRYVILERMMWKPASIPTPDPGSDLLEG